LAEIDKHFLDRGESMRLLYESKTVLLRAFNASKKSKIVE
jgi:hypothetical protein